MARGARAIERQRRQEDLQAKIRDLTGLSPEEAQEAAQRLTTLFHDVQSVVRHTINELHHYKHEGVPELQ